jgi:peroxiredoxin
MTDEFKGTDLIPLKVEIKEKEQDVLNYKKKFNILCPILMDDNASVATAYGVWNHPETFFINRDGKIVGRVMKEMDWTSKTVTNLIQSLLREKK